MSKQVEINYKKYLCNNFNKLFKYLNKKEEYTDDWYNEILSYNNIIGSLIGIIEAKGLDKDFQNCKDFILKYYETTYPEKQLKEVDDALYSKMCYQYVKYALQNLVCDEIDSNILKEFLNAYLKGYKLASDISLKSVLPYYSKKMNEYNHKLQTNEYKKCYK